MSKEKSKQNALYEIVFILDAEEKNKEKIKGKIVDLIEGDKVKFEDLGVKNFAYPIKKKTKGHYFLYQTRTSGEKIAKLHFKITTWKEIIRSLIINLDKEKKFRYSEEFIQKIKNEKEQKEELKDNEKKE